jgi:HD superfamily phosphohydrolase
MDKLNTEFEGKLSLAIKIFNNQYPKKFLHQLVSSQLDMDRLDYLKRDSFFTGVSEGVISSDRIIKMLNVVNNELVVENKAIYSIEKFLIARRLMYWQVYLHKTVLSAETLLVNILMRAKELAAEGKKLFATPSLGFFLENDFKEIDFEVNTSLLDQFSKLDDSDVDVSIKVWTDYEDKILSKLCQNLLERKLYKIEIQNEPFSQSYSQTFIDRVCTLYAIDKKDAHYFVIQDVVNNSAYTANQFNINILMNDGKLIDVAQASDQLNIQSLSKTVSKYFLCYPKELRNL